MSRTRAFFLSLLLLISVAVQTRAQTQTQTYEVPKELNYQGYISILNTPLSTGTYTFAFRFFDVASGGTALLEETQQVSVDNGVFNVVIGSQTEGGITLPFDRQYYLEVVVNLGNGTFSPERMPLLTSPYAFRARHIDDAGVKAGQNITLSRDPQTGALVISAAAGNGGTTVMAGDGLAGTTTNGVLSLALAAGGVNATYLATASVTTGKLADGAVTTPKIADNAVSSAKLTNGSITIDKLAATGAAAGQVLSYNGSNLQWISNSGGLTTPYTVDQSSTDALMTLKNDGSGSALALRSDQLNAGNPLVSIYSARQLTPALHARATGNGTAAYFYSTSPSATEPAVTITNEGRGRALQVYENNAQSSETGIYVEHKGTGSALKANSTGSGRVAEFVSSSSLIHPAVTISNDGMGRGLEIIQSNSNSNEVGLFVDYKGRSDALVVTHSGASGELGLFKNGSTRAASINRYGGFHTNAGTGSYMWLTAEGGQSAYEAGDVIAVSDDVDGQVEKSEGASSTRVVGVAWGTGGISTSLGEPTENMIMVQTSGVAQIHVVLENGPISRGDLLVSSSTPGYAMKAGPNPPTGSVIGKAMQNYTVNAPGDLIILIDPR